jgi:hypothetical protein
MNEPPVNVETLTRVAQEVADGLPTVDHGDWPDCFDVSHALKEELMTTYGVDPQYVSVEELHLPPEYRHYVVVCDAEVTGERLLVDASFAQFAIEADTPFELAPAATISSVVVCPKPAYVFAEYLR